MLPRIVPIPGKVEPLLSRMLHPPKVALSLLEEGKGSTSSVQSYLILKQRMLDLLPIPRVWWHGLGEVGDASKGMSFSWGALGRGAVRRRRARVYSHPFPLGLQPPLPVFSCF